MPSLSEGDKAPDFTLPADNNSEISLKSLKGKKIVLYFYPKDMTPGCTTESCDFRDHMGVLKKQGVAVIGISRDSVERHDKFKAKHDLNFPLGADEDGAVCGKYGVWVEKSLYGRKFMGIERATFLIGEDGKILKIWRKVKVKNHVREIIDTLAAIKKAA